MHTLSVCRRRCLGLKNRGKLQKKEWPTPVFPESALTIYKWLSGGRRLPADRAIVPPAQEGERRFFLNILRDPNYAAIPLRIPTICLGCREWAEEMAASAVLTDRMSG